MEGGAEEWVMKMLRGGEAGWKRGLDTNSLEDRLCRERWGGKMKWMESWGVGQHVGRWYRALVKAQKYLKTKEKLPKLSHLYPSRTSAILREQWLPQWQICIHRRTNCLGVYGTKHSLAAYTVSTLPTPIYPLIIYSISIFKLINMENVMCLGESVAYLSHISVRLTQHEHSWLNSRSIISL